VNWASIRIDSFSKILKARLSCGEQAGYSKVLFNTANFKRVGKEDRKKKKPCGYNHRTSTLNSLVMKLKPTLILTLISAKCYAELFF